MYLHLTPTTMNPFSLAKKDYSEAKKHWLCTGCNRPFPNIGPIDVQIQNSKVQGPLNFIQGAGLGVAQKSFLIRLGKERVARDLQLGAITSPAGPLSDWVTFVGRQHVLVRGSKNVSYRACSSCGRTVYFAMGKHYLFPKPEACAEIYDSGWGGIVIPKELSTILGFEKDAGVLVETLEVLDEPCDGLPLLLP